MQLGRALLALGLVFGLTLSASAAPKKHHHHHHVLLGVVVAVEKDTIVVMTHHHHHAKKATSSTAGKHERLHKVHVTASTEFVELERNGKGKLKMEPASLRDVHKGEHVAITMAGDHHHDAHKVEIFDLGHPRHRKPGPDGKKPGKA
jgi:hypothetical protein